MQQPLPNPELIGQLIESYYRTDPDSQDREFVSSHWRHYGDQFEVQTDAAGNLISLQGVGFGVAKWHGLGNRLLDQLCAVSTIAGLPCKLEILRLRSIAAKLCRQVGLDPTTNIVRQLFCLNLIRNNLAVAGVNGSKLRFLMIGDGYGVLAALVKVLFPESSLVLVDMGKSLLFQSYYCQMAHPDCTHQLAVSMDSNYNADFVYCPTERLSSLSHLEFDVAINIASMQEMSNETVQRYFDFLRKGLKPAHLFYCLNREYKELIGGEISKFIEYPWLEGDRHLVDDNCAWYKYYFARKTPGEGRNAFGVRLPLFNYFDGLHRQRLSVLKIDRSGN